MVARVLVIEDSRAMRAALKHCLTDLGVEVSEAENGRHALSVMARQPGFDVVFTDWIMPEMDGIAWLRAIKSKPEYRSLKVVMVTSNHDIITAIETGVDRFITKPFSKGMLRNALVRLGIPVAPGEF